MRNMKYTVGQTNSNKNQSLGSKNPFYFREQFI